MWNRKIMSKNRINEFQLLIWFLSASYLISIIPSVMKMDLSFFESGSSRKKRSDKDVRSSLSRSLPSPWNLIHRSFVRWKSSDMTPTRPPLHRKYLDLFNFTAYRMHIIPHCLHGWTWRMWFHQWMLMHCCTQYSAGLFFYWIHIRLSLYPDFRSL